MSEKRPKSSVYKPRERMKVYLPSLLITLLGFVVAYQFVEPAPPKEITIATGDMKGAYYAFAKRYAAILSRQGITLHVRSTEGSVENIKLLQNPDSGVDIAFVQGGVGQPASSPNFTSLASLYFEPLWVFYRNEAPLVKLTQLRGKSIAVGPEGSGARALALELLKDNGINDKTASLTSLDGQTALEFLRSGEVYAAFFVASVDSSLVRTAMETEGVALMCFERAEAYTRVHRFLTGLTLPQGALDFKRNLPAKDCSLLSATATLVIHENFHPALIDLVLMAASEVHGGGGLFEELFEFPSRKHLHFPINKEALRYFKSGPPFLQKYLPFWAASLADRLKVMLLPFLTLLFPLFKVAPPTYRWRVRSRILPWYRELQALDLMVDESDPPEKLNAYLSELERIEKEVTGLNIPLSYASELYSLRLHIAHVRKKIEALRSQDSSS